MSYIVSIRTNQSFTIDHETNELMPQTEVVILVQKPSYEIKKGKIYKSFKIEEMRFDTTAAVLATFIEMLTKVHANAKHYAEISRKISNQVTAAPEGEPTK